MQPALKQPRTVCQLPGRAQIKLSITGRVYGNYMFVNMLEKCALGSSSMCSEKQFCSEITFQMDEGDPHQITDTRGILTLPVLLCVKKSPDRKSHNKQSTVESMYDAMFLFIKTSHSVLAVVQPPLLLLNIQSPSLASHAAVKRGVTLTLTSDIQLHKANIIFSECY